MADEEQGEKSEQATDARREEFRNRGQVAQTRELASAAILLASAGGIYMLSKFFFQNLFEVFNSSFGIDMVQSIRDGDMKSPIQFAAFKTLLLIAPVLGIVGLLSFASTVAQIGFLQVEDAISPKFDKIDPIAGFKRIFSLRNLVEGLKSIVKILAIGFILYTLLKGELDRVPYLMTFSIEQLLTYMGTIVVKLFIGIGSTMLILAGADYFFQRWDLEKQMMMTKQEVKEESKQREGDPMIKSRIRRIQREMANRRMMDAVKKADVVVTNPTHIAVVLKYGEKLPAPQLVAKGADLIAEKIKEMAREHNIPIIENKPLARTIYKTMKIGQIIPRELFVAVAEVLSYVYKLKRKVKK